MVAGGSESQSTLTGSRAGRLLQSRGQIQRSGVHTPGRSLPLRPLLSACRVTHFPLNAQAEIRDQDVENLPAAVTDFTGDGCDGSLKGDASVMWTWSVCFCSDHHHTDHFYVFLFLLLHRKRVFLPKWCANIGWKLPITLSGILRCLHITWELHLPFHTVTISRCTTGLSGIEQSRPSIIGSAVRAPPPLVQVQWVWTFSPDRQAAPRLIARHEGWNVLLKLLEWSGPTSGDLSKLEKHVASRKYLHMRSLLYILDFLFGWLNQ